MNDNQKFEEAKDMINTLVTQLSVLNNGEDIPPTWKNYFIKAIRPLPKKSGRKLDPKKHADLVNRITDDLAKLNEGRSSDHNPAEYKDRIAIEFGISRKTVERALDDVNKTIGGDESLDPDRRKSTIEGISDHITDSLEASDREEDEVRKKRVEQNKKRIKYLPPI